MILTISFLGFLTWLLFRSHPYQSKMHWGKSKYWKLPTLMHQLATLWSRRTLPLQLFQDFFSRCEMTSCTADIIIKWEIPADTWDNLLWQWRLTFWITQTAKFIFSVTGTFKVKTSLSNALSRDTVNSAQPSIPFILHPTHIALELRF